MACAAVVGSLLVVAAAPFVGSFLGVLVRRLPKGQEVIFSRSACPHCAQRLSARDLIPFVSWSLSFGHCRFCGHSLGVFYPAIELAAVAIALWSASVLSGWQLWAACAFGWTLLALAVIDWSHFLLPDALTLPLVPAELLVAYWFEVSDFEEFR